MGRREYKRGMPIEAARCLEDLDARIDPEAEADLLRQWVDFLEGRFTGGVFAPRRRCAVPPTVEWPKIGTNAAFDNPELMVLRELAGCSHALAQGSGAILNVRCNYSTGLLPSVFGAELFIMDEAMDTLPTSTPYRGGGLGPMRELLARGAPQVRAGLGERTFDTAERFLDVFRRYPNIGRWVRLYHPDLQGPMDVTELLWGSSLFYDIVDAPETVNDALALVTETYGRFMREWEALVPPTDRYAAHWGLLHRGRIMLRDDSAMNFSPEMFDTFIRPYDARLLAEFGGGAIHFCGRGSHYIESASTIPGLYAIQLSQPEYNDMETIYRNTVDKGIALLALNRKAADEALSAGRSLRGRVHC